MLSMAKIRKSLKERGIRVVWANVKLNGGFAYRIYGTVAPLNCGSNLYTREDLERMAQELEPWEGAL